MKKTIAYCVIISMELLLIFAFCFHKKDNSKTLVSYNDNMFKMADSVLLLYESENTKEEEDTTLEEEEETTEEMVELTSEEPATIEVASEPEEVVEVVQEPVIVPSNIGSYNSKPEMGFNVTSGNTTYSLSDADFIAVSAVINCEGTTLDDKLAVASVILNRADANGSTPLGVVAAHGQFTCYNYYINGSAYASELSNTVLRDALSGIRNNNYRNFNGWYSSYANYISDGGNRFY